MNEVTKDQAVSWGVRAAVVAAGIAVLAVILPIAILAVKAGMALAALGVLAVVGVGIAQALPLLGQKWENKVLSMRKSEARINRRGKKSRTWKTPTGGPSSRQPQS